MTETFDCRAALRAASLLLLLGVSACNQPPLEMATQAPPVSAEVDAVPEAARSYRLNNSSTRVSQLVHFVDPATGCEYLAYTEGGLTPRFGTECFPIPARGQP